MAYYESLILYFDGASRNNPRGPAGCGWVLYDNDGYELNEIESGNNYLGYNVSNNQAEYQGLTDGLDYIVNNGISCDELLVRGDAEIVIRQMTGRYQVRSHNRGQ